MVLTNGIRIKFKISLTDNLPKLSEKFWWPINYWPFELNIAQVSSNSEVYTYSSRCVVLTLWMRLTLSFAVRIIKVSTSLYSLLPDGSCINLTVSKLPIGDQCLGRLK